MKEVSFELEKKRAFVWLSDRTNMTAIVVKTRNKRMWTQQDRIDHTKQRQALALEASIATSGFIKYYVVLRNIVVYGQHSHESQMIIERLLNLVDVDFL